MPAIDWPGYARLQQKLDRLSNIPRQDLNALAETLEQIVIEDNRRGVLAGLDKDGNPMPPVTYRGSARTPAHKAPGGPKRFGKHGGTFQKHGGTRASSSSYKNLTGPPLAPRGAQSRVITNVVGTSKVIGNNIVEAAITWRGVVSKQGVEFLPAHFNGSVVGRGQGRFKLKVRDLRGVRPWGKQQAKEAIREWTNKLLRK